MYYDATYYNTESNLSSCYPEISLSWIGVPASVNENETYKIQTGHKLFVIVRA